MKRLFLLMAVCLGFAAPSQAQDLIYTISAFIETQRTSLDSIVVKNITKGSEITFRNLPDVPDYQINLTKKAFWGTSSANAIQDLRGFHLIRNQPGSITIGSSYEDISDATVTLYNLSGQKIFMKKDLWTNHATSIHVEIGLSGIYLLNITGGNSSQTFKVIGASNDGNIAVREGINPNQNPKIKSQKLSGAEDFEYETGDSLRFFAFKSDYYALPNALRISGPQSMGFEFEEVLYTDRNEIAFPDSLGELVYADIDGMIIACRKVDGKYFYQGDIVLSEEQLNLSKTKGASISYWQNVWPEGIVYYNISDELRKDAMQYPQILKAIEHWNVNTPLQFMHKSFAPDTENWIEFLRSDGDSYSYLGMQKEEQPIALSSTASVGTIIHEIGHAVGLIHEHCRPDRDEYVKVYDTNIIPEYYASAYTPAQTAMYTTEFDWNSVMLYSSHRNFAIDKSKPVMVKKEDLSEIIVQRSYLSPLDVLIVENLYAYECYGRPKVITTDVVNTTATTADLRGNIVYEGGKPLEARGFGWRKEGEWRYQYVNVAGGLGVYSYTLSGLDPETTYYFFAFGTNENGMTIGDLVKFETKIDFDFITDALTIDGKAYNTVIIGNQEWMAENLAYLPAVSPPNAVPYKDPAYFVMDYHGTSVSMALKTTGYLKYGTLYNYYAAQNACPTGWRLPSKNDWEQMAKYISDQKGPYTFIDNTWEEVGNHLKSEKNWDTFSGINGSNGYGFSAIPGGCVRTGSFAEQFINGYWWTSNSLDEELSVGVNLSRKNSNLAYQNVSKNDGLSIRCVRDIQQGENTFVDSRDGKVYKWVKIGNQTWMAENLAFATTNGSWAYDNDFTNIGKYGYLYNYETALKVCPSGWHLSSFDEWKTLAEYITSQKGPYYHTDSFWDNVGGHLKSLNGWEEYYKDGNGTNDFGFSALPGGYGKVNGSEFSTIGYNGKWWTSTEFNDYGFLMGKSITLTGANAGLHSGAAATPYGYSVRCIKD